MRSRMSDQSKLLSITVLASQIALNVREATIQLETWRLAVPGLWHRWFPDSWSGQKGSGKLDLEYPWVCAPVQITKTKTLWTIISTEIRNVVTCWGWDGAIWFTIFSSITVSSYFVGLRPFLSFITATHRYCFVCYSKNDEIPNLHWWCKLKDIAAQVASRGVWMSGKNSVSEMDARNLLLDLGTPSGVARGGARGGGCGAPRAIRVFSYLGVGKYWLRGTSNSGVTSGCKSSSYATECPHFCLSIVTFWLNAHLQYLCHVGARGCRYSTVNPFCTPLEDTNR